MIELETTGMNDIIGKLKKFSMKDAVNNTMEKASQTAKNYAETYSPWATGELRKSIYSYTIPNGFVLGASAKHAVFNEYGSITTPIGSIQAPLPAKIVGVRPFLRPALYKVKQEISKTFKKSCEELISHG